MGVCLSSFGAGALIRYLFTMGGCLGLGFVTVWDHVVALVASVHWLIVPIRDHVDASIASVHWLIFPNWDHVLTSVMSVHWLIFPIRDHVAEETENEGQVVAAEEDENEDRVVAANENENGGRGVAAQETENLGENLGTELEPIFLPAILGRKRGELTMYACLPN